VPEGAAAMRSHVVGPLMAQVIGQNAKLLASEEWAHILDLLAYEHECNENPLSKSALDKLLGDSKEKG
jgi:hypothetical protein